jgi:precorrin-4 methylase
MQTLTERHGIHNLNRALRQLDLGLARVPELSSMRPAVAALRQKVTAAAAAHEDVREQRIAASAEIAYYDEEIDFAVVTAGQTLYLQVDRDRSAPAYKKLFPVSPSQMTADLASPRQETYVTALVDTIRGDETYAALRPVADALAGWSDRLRQAQARRQELYVQEAQARGTLMAVADEARRFYNGLYYQFMVQLPDRKRLVESLFMTFTTTAAAGTDVPSADPSVDPV